MDPKERGFTLIELAVAVAILSLLLAAGAWAFSLHPNSLDAAANDLDAAFASARAIAASSGNGATIVFAPRVGVKGGFELLLYRGRPNAANAVTPANAMPVLADANVRERTLGAPPFAIFVDSAGNASGEPAYPAFGANQTATFPVIASEPPCPSGGFLFTISALATRASQTRSLPCRATLSSAAPPNPSPTPNVPIVTPTALLFHWPADAQQSFVATEWGYAHWFASGDGFSCGSGVAAFPDVLPSPYSGADSSAEASASPPPPSQTPYSYPNSGGGSTNDAPALFPLQPQGAGLCTASVRDEYGQSATTQVAVMGWLTATYGSSAATHASGAIAIPSSALPGPGANATIALAKSYDATPLAPRVLFTGSSASACANDLGVTSSAGTTPNAQSATPATATVTLSVNAMPPAALNCSGFIYNHYSDRAAPSDAASESGEGVAFAASLGPATGPLATLGKIVLWLQPGSGACASAQLYLQSGAVDANAPNASDAFNQTDANGCVTNSAPVLWASERNYTGSFSVDLASCASFVGASPLAWSAGADAALAPLAATPACAFDVRSSDQSNDAISAIVNACSGSTLVVGIGTGCAIALPDAGTQGDLDCTGGGSGGTQTTTTVTWDPPLPALGDYAGGVWTRTAPGAQSVTWSTVTIGCLFVGDRGSTHVIGRSGGTYTFN